MAFKFARQSGPWTSGSTWDNGVVPTTGDWIYSNGWTVAIDQNIDVESLRNTTTRIGVPDIATPAMTSNTTPIGYTVSSSRLNSAPWVLFNQNLAANGVWASGVPNRGTIWFNFPSGSVGPVIKRYALYKYSSGQIYQPVQWSLSGRNSTAEPWTDLEIVSGSPAASNTHFSPTLPNTASYTMYQLDITRTNNILYEPYIYALELSTDTGSATGWGGGGGFTATGSRTMNFSGEGVVSNGGNLLTINSTTGSIINLTRSGAGYIMGPNCQIANGDARVINIANTATVNYTGDMYGTRNTGGSYSRAGQFFVGAASTVNIVGNVYGCELNAGYESVTMTLGGAGATINITGNVYGQTNQAFRSCIWATTTGNLNIVGSIYSTLGNCIWITGNTKLVHTGPIQNANANGYSAIISSANSLTAPTIVTGPLTTTGSINPLSSNRIQFPVGTNITWQYQNVANQNVNLYSYPAGLPSGSDIRSGSRYGGSNEFVGSLIVADPSNVRKGVPTDNTTGSAQLTAADFLSAISSSSDPLAIRLRNVATVDTVGGQIAAFTP